jgi:hypothetical protein
MTALDKTAASTLIVLTVLLAALSWMGNPIGLGISLDQKQGVGAFGPLTLEFDQPVQPVKVQEALTITSDIAFRVEAQSATRLFVIPDAPLLPETNYRVKLKAGILGKNSERLKRDIQWQVLVRPLQIAFLQENTGTRDLWRIGLDDPRLVQITHDRQILDFDVAPDGEQIAFSYMNESGGVDIGLVGRDGYEKRQVIDCGQNRCTTPAWSSDGQKIAYTRQAVGIVPGSTPGAPRPWIFDCTSLQSSLVYTDEQIIGYGPSWSPNGLYLATWDGVAGGIRVLNLETGEDTLIPTQTGVVGSWSPDGSQMFYTSMEQVEEMFRTKVYKMDLKSAEIGTFLENEEYDASFGIPVWSPDGSRIALSMRENGENLAHGLWIVNPSHLGGSFIQEDPEFDYRLYSWDPWGRMIVFQRSRLKGKYIPEIAVYRLETGQIQVMVENGSWPKWLP